MQGTSRLTRRGPILGNRRGAAYLIGITALVTGVIVSLALLRASQNSFVSERSRERVQMAANLAEAGVDYVAWQFTDNYLNVPYTADVALSTGSFHVSAVNYGASVPLTAMVTCTGTCGGVTSTSKRVINRRYITVLAALEPFSYSPGNLNGKGPWVGNAVGEIQVMPDRTMEIRSNVLAYVESNWSIAGYTGQNNQILVQFKVTAGTGGPDYFFWDLHAFDTGGREMGWWYGKTDSLRGRYSGSVTQTLVLEPRWHVLDMVINTSTKQTSYYADGRLLGTLPHLPTANNSLGSLQFRSWDQDTAVFAITVDDLGYGYIE